MHDLQCVSVSVCVCNIEKETKTERGVFIVSFTSLPNEFLACERSY